MYVNATHHPVSECLKETHTNLVNAAFLPPWCDFFRGKAAPRRATVTALSLCHVACATVVPGILKASRAVSCGTPRKLATLLIVVFLADGLRRPLLFTVSFQDIVSLFDPMLKRAAGALV